MDDRPRCNCGKEMIAHWKANVLVADSTGQVHCTIFDAMKALEPYLLKTVQKEFQPEQFVGDDEQTQHRAEKLMSCIAALPFNFVCEIQNNDIAGRNDVVIRELEAAADMFTTEQPYIKPYPMMPVDCADQIISTRFEDAGWSDGAGMTIVHQDGATEVAVRSVHLTIELTDDPEGCDVAGDCGLLRHERTGKCIIGTGEQKEFAIEAVGPIHVMSLLMQAKTTYIMWLCAAVVMSLCDRYA